MRIHYLQHVPFEGLGQIQSWADSGGHPVTATRLFAGDPFPALADIDFLIIMGGPMSANDDDRLPWIKPEKAFIAAAIEQRKLVLGICLGAQLIASVLGARVYPNRQKEIGWFPIDLDAGSSSALSVLPAHHIVFQWHGETFDLPRGARHLARSSVCENQALAVDDHVIGLQYHIEVTPATIEDMITHARDEMVAQPFVQQPDEIRALSPTYAPALPVMLTSFLDAFVAARRPSFR